MTKTLVVSVCCVLLGIFSERATRVKEEGRGKREEGRGKREE
jgi:hypothetical protein